MTDSTTDTNPGDGAFEAGTSVDELFGEFEIGDESGDERRTTEGEDEAGGDGTDDIEDATAADVFDQLRADTVDEGGADAVLADESPEDIIASADEPEPEPDTPVDDDLLADEDELEDLLLTGRTKEQEFLWVETEASDETDESVESNDGATTAAETDPETVVDDTPREDNAGDTIENSDVNDTTQNSDTEGAAESDADADRGTASIAVSTDRTPTSSARTESDDAPGSTGTDIEGGDEPADVPASRDDGSSGVFGWLRSILGGLF